MSNIIDSIQLSGVTYDISGSGGVPESAFTAYTASTNSRISEDEEVTAAALNDLNESLSGKQETLVAGSGITISGNVISATGGGSITIDPSLDSGSTNAVANSAITNAFENINDRLSEDEEVTAAALNDLNETISGISANSTVELTQAQYDELVASGTVQSNTYYIITDASAGDLTQYWTSAQTNSAITEATSGKVDSSSVVSSVTSASTDSEIPTAKAVWDAIPTGGTGGGKAISAGTNISVTTGETADTVSCTLNVNNYETGYAGKGLTLTNGNSLVAKGTCSTVGGNNAKTKGSYSFAYGSYLMASGETEAAFGRYNSTNYSNNTFGNSGNTLFSVGNGTADNARHNAFEIRQNGDIYLNDGTNDVKLQDTITATAANTAALGGLSLVKLTQSEYDALSPNYDSNTLYVIT